MIKKDNHPTDPWMCDIRGQGVHYHRRFPTRKAAEKFETQIRATRGQSSQGTSAPCSGAQTFEEFVRARIAEESASGTLRPSTVAGWKSKLKNMPKWLRRKQLHRITGRDCVRYLRSLVN